MLAHTLGEPVADQTGLDGTYDFKLDFAPLTETDSTPPSIFTALQEQLGLQLKRQKVPWATLAIDHVDRIPTEK
jgi:uncharacterized protein (TIGR03435 family)